MSFQSVKELVLSRGYQNEFLQHDVAHTCYDTASYLNVEVGSIAKTMVIKGKEKPILLVIAGDAKIDNAKFKAIFNFRPSFMGTQEAESLTGFVSGGVCPFGSRTHLPIYLDISLKKYDVVYPACGSQTDSLIMTCDELFTLAQANKWVDVAK